jgi:ATP:corrinoid adenosyltransferase
MDNHRGLIPTDCYAPTWIVALADTLRKSREIKHHYNVGIEY